MFNSLKVSLIILQTNYLHLYVEKQQQTNENTFQTHQFCDGQC